MSTSLSLLLSLISRAALSFAAARAMVNARIAMVDSTPMAHVKVFQLTPPSAGWRMVGGPFPHLNVNMLIGRPNVFEKDTEARPE